MAARKKFRSPALKASEAKKRAKRERASQKRHVSNVNTEKMLREVEGFVPNRFPSR